MDTERTFADRMWDVTGLEAFRERARTRLQKRIRMLDVAAVMTVFMVFAAVNWMASGSEIPYDYLWKVVKPFHTFPAGDWIELYLGSGWGVSGKQFFLFPLLAVLGVSPFVLKGISVVVYALAGVLLYLALARKFDRAIALTIPIIFITFRAFAKWRNGDMYLFFFLSTLFVYLYIRWRDTWDTRMLYAMGFTAGLGAYVKTLMLYPVLALLLATVLLDREALRTVSSRDAAKTAGALLVGAAPLLVHSFYVGFRNWSLHQTLRNLPGLGEGIAVRLPQFYKITAPGRPLADGVMQTTPHIYTVLFLSGLVLCLLRRRDLVYVAGFVFAFLFSLVTPQASLPVHQMMVVYPFVLILVAQNLAVVRDAVTLHRVAPFLAAAALLVTFGHLTTGVIHPGSVTMEEYAIYEDLEVGDTVAVNTRHAYAVTMFDGDVSRRILAPHNWTYKFFIDREDRITVPEAVERYRNGTVSLMLAESGRCDRLFYGAPRCGYPIEDVQTLGIEVRRGEELVMEQYVYRFLPSSRPRPGLTLGSTADSR